MKSIAPTSFDDVLLAAQSGEDRATSLLYLDYVAMVHGYLRACGADEPDDLTSDVFIGMVRGIERFHGDEPDFRKWLMTIAHRRLVDHRRQRSRNRLVLVEHASLESSQDCRGGAADAVADLDPRLVESFAALTDAQREVLALRFVADVSLQGVAAITGRPTGAVKSLQNRGLASLRRLLASNRVELGA